jgi:hypothetical protein
MPAKLRLLGSMLLISFVVAAADAPPTPPPDMDLIEFLGAIETDSASAQDVMDAIDTELPPDLPEKPLHEHK